MAEGTSAGRRRYRPIPPEAMEVIADVFLLSTHRDENFPAYSEDQLRRKERRASGAEEHFEKVLALQGAWEGEDGYILDRAGLTQDERAAWELYSEGYTASEISRFLHVSRPTAVRLLKSTARRISARNSMFGGLQGIYLREVHKRIYRKPTHCAERACRGLGYCRYALRG